MNRQSASIALCAVLVGASAAPASAWYWDPNYPQASQGKPDQFASKYLGVSRLIEWQPGQYFDYGNGQWIPQAGDDPLSPPKDAVFYSFGCWRVTFDVDASRRPIPSSIKPAPDTVTTFRSFGIARSATRTTITFGTHTPNENTYTEPVEVEPIASAEIDPSLWTVNPALGSAPCSGSLNFYSWLANPQELNRASKSVTIHSDGTADVRIRYPKTYDSVFRYKRITVSKQFIQVNSQDSPVTPAFKASADESLMRYVVPERLRRSGIAIKQIRRKVKFNGYYYTGTIPWVDKDGRITRKDLRKMRRLTPRVVRARAAFVGRNPACPLGKPWAQTPCLDLWQSQYLKPERLK